MNAADLRTLALSRATLNHPVNLILDDQLRGELVDATHALGLLLQQRDELARAGDVPAPQPTSLTEEAVPTPDIDRTIEKAREVIAAVEQEALDAGVVLVLNFHRLAPAEYQVNLEKAERDARKAAKTDQDTNQSELFLNTFKDRLVGLCFTGASTPGGEPVDLSLDEIRAQVCTHTDIDQLRDHCVTINREGQAAPLVRASSGRPATT